MAQLTILYRHCTSSGHRPLASSIMAYLISLHPFSLMFLLLPTYLPLPEMVITPGLEDLLHLLTECWLQPGRIWPGLRALWDLKTCHRMARHWCFPFLVPMVPAL